MTPEQKRIQDAAIALTEALDAFVPSSTIHWVVETARTAARNLAAYSDTVKTRDAED